MESALNNNYLMHQYSSGNHQKNSSINKDDILNQAVIDLYIGLKQKLKQYSQGKINSTNNDGKDASSIDDYNASVGITDEEKKRLSQLGNLVLIDYIRSSMDILLNLKLENAIAENQANKFAADAYINSSRGGHGAPNLLDGAESQRSSDQSSQVTSREGPPKVYEEIIQNLEADVRKHIRIEQQLKLHIESVECRLDELELENDKFLKEQEKFEQLKNDIQQSQRKKQEQIEEEVRKLKQELKDQESKYYIESKQVQERFQLEKEQLLQEVSKLQQEVKKSQQQLSQQQLQLQSQQQQNSTQKSFLSTEVCSQCRALISPSKSSGPQQLSNFDEGRSGNKNDLSLDTLEKKISNNSNTSAGATKKMLFKRANINCNCLCQQCQIVHQQQENMGQQAHQHMQSATNNHYKMMQMQFLDKSLQNNTNLIMQQDQNELVKYQKDFNKFMVAEKRQSNTNKKRNGNSGNNYIQTGTPDKKNPQSVTSILNALNIQMNSTQSQSRKSNNQTFIQSSSCCCQQMSNKHQTNPHNKLSTSYYTQNDENPYLGSLQMHPNLHGKLFDSSNTSKNQMLFDQSSNSSLNQQDNSMVMIQSKKQMQRQTIGGTVGIHTNLMQNCGSGGQLDQELSYLQGMRQGLSNDGLNGLIFSGGQFDIAQYGNEMDDNSNDSLLNSHRRSRSQNVGSKSKSERKGGRMLMMKNRLQGNNQNINQNEIMRSGAYQSTKNGSIQRETTPLKSLNQTKQLGKTQQSNNILNSEERKKLFNTFMKEMNQSLVNQGSTSKKKKGPNAVGISESIQQMRGISNPSSRPRSQLAVNPPQSQTVNNNYSSLVNNSQTAVGGQASLKYKFVNNNQGTNGSRNTQINKIKDFFIHNTYNASLGNSTGGGPGGNNLVQQILGINSQLSMQGSSNNNRNSIKKQNQTQDNYQFSPMRKKQLTQQ